MAFERLCDYLQKMPRGYHPPSRSTGVSHAPFPEFEPPSEATASTQPAEGLRTPSAPAEEGAASTAILSWVEEMEVEMRRREEENLAAAKEREKMAARVRAANAAAQATTEAAKEEAEQAATKREASQPASVNSSPEEASPTISAAEAVFAELVEDVKAQLSPPPPLTTPSAAPSQLRQPRSPPNNERDDSSSEGGEE